MEPLQILEPVEYNSESKKIEYDDFVILSNHSEKECNDTWSGISRRVLVVEDSSKHRADAVEFFRAREAPDLLVNYVTSLASYGSNVWHNSWDEYSGVILDIYFPLTAYPQWDQPEPIGVALAFILQEKNIPFVLNTAGFHHGRRYEWIHQLADYRGWPLVSTGGYAEHDPHQEIPGQHKDWERAYSRLEELMDEAGQ